jgi:hypothetical protein
MIYKFDKYDASFIQKCGLLIKQTSTKMKMSAFCRNYLILKETYIVLRGYKIREIEIKNINNEIQYYSIVLRSSDITLIHILFFGYKFPRH